VVERSELGRRIVSLTTLGTPHLPPPKTDFWGSIDQTRGLLAYVTDNFPGAYHPELRCALTPG
jgi:hypothetical protein